MVTKRRQWCDVGHGFVAAVDMSLAQISNGRRSDFRGSHGSGLAAVHVRVDGQIIVGLQARQVRVANASAIEQNVYLKRSLYFTISGLRWCDGLTCFS